MLPEFTTSTKSTCWEVSPVSFFYDFLFDGTPHFDDIEKMLNILALLAALTLSISCSMMGAVSYSDCEEYKQRVTTAPFKCWSDAKEGTSSGLRSPGNYVVATRSIPF